jgi:nicotinamidase-related amidase
MNKSGRTKNDTAVIIVDMQEFFLQAFPQALRDKFINEQEKVIDACLKLKMPFFLVEYKAGGSDRGKTIQKLGTRIKGSLEETVIKESNGAFTDTSLDALLKKAHVKKIVLFGLNANGCIQDSAMGALRRGYEVLTSQGIIASSSRKDLSLSKRNKEWFVRNVSFFEDTESLIKELNR